MRQLVLIVFVAFAFSAGSACAEDSPVPPSDSTPLGRWLTASGNLEVEVAPCGQALCGTVVRVLGNRSMSAGGGEMTPADTRDPMGMQILIDFVPTEFRETPASDGGAAKSRIPTRWNGQIYNRENAKTY